MNDPAAPKLNAQKVWQETAIPSVLGSSSGTRAKLVRFGISGACATAFYFLATNALHYVFGAAPGASSVLGYVMSVLLSYLLQSRFTFRVRNDSSQQVGRFIAATLIGLAVSWGLVYFLYNVLEQPIWVGTIGVCVAIPILNYILFHLWVFVRLDEKTDIA